MGRLENGIRVGYGRRIVRRYGRRIG